MSSFIEDWFLETYFNMLKTENPEIDTDGIKEHFYKNKREQTEREFTEQIKKEKEEEYMPHLRKVTISDKDGKVIQECEEIVTICKPKDTDQGQDL